MSLVLKTQPTLLRTKLYSSRAGLLGATIAKSGGNPVVASVLPSKNKNVFSLFSGLGKQLTQIMATIAIVGALTVGGVLLAPKLYYALASVETVPIKTTEEGTALGGEFAPNPPAKEEKPAYIPPKDDSLPEGKWLIIPRIGVRTQLHETENAEEALEKGVWKVPGYGNVGDTDLPVILAAHRFGWQWWWKTDYWKYNSFYLLPDTEPGDIIEIIDDQRKWTYELYAGEEGEEIQDYDADVILYTCKYLDSPVRHFRYARLIDPTADSQSLTSES